MGSRFYELISPIHTGHNWGEAWEQVEGCGFGVHLC